MLRGIKLLARNPAIMLIPLAGIVVFYLILVAGVLTIIPAEQLINLGDIEKLKEFVTANPSRSVAVFILFGIVAFVALEFFNAALIGSSLDVATNGRFRLSDSWSYGLLYTPRLVALDLLCSLALLAFAMPFTLLYYITESKIAYFAALLSALLSTPLLTMPRYVLIAENCGIFEAISEGFEFAIQNYPRIMVAIILAAVIALPSAIGLAFIAAPVANSLLSIWLNVLYVKDNTPKI